MAGLWGPWLCWRAGLSYLRLCSRAELWFPTLLWKAGLWQSRVLRQFRKVESPRIMLWGIQSSSINGGTFAPCQPLYLLLQKLLQDTDALWVGEIPQCDVKCLFKCLPTLSYSHTPFSSHFSLPQPVSARQASKLLSIQTHLHLQLLEVGGSARVGSVRSCHRWFPRPLRQPFTTFLVK